MSHRDRLLAAARECLVTQGYAHTTARDLVAVSGTNLGSIGYHFGSKEALLNLALAEAQAEYTEKVLAVATAADAGDRPLESVRSSWSEMVAGFEGMRALTIALFEALVQAERSEDLRTSLAATHHELRMSIAATLERLDLGTEDNRVALASFMMAVCDGLQLQWLLDPDHTPSGGEVFDAALSAFAPSAGHSESADR
jgi:AcrR family transcriptional regulator